MGDGWPKSGIEIPLERREPDRVVFSGLWFYHFAHQQRGDAPACICPKRVPPAVTVTADWSVGDWKMVANATAPAQPPDPAGYTVTGIGGFASLTDTGTAVRQELVAETPKANPFCPKRPDAWRDRG